MSSQTRSLSRLSLRLLTAILLLSGGSNTALAAPFATIGATGDCAYNQSLPDQVQAAINDAETDIRLVGGLEYVGAISLSPNSDVSIRGGYASCADAANDQLPASPSASTIRPKAGQAIALFVSEGATSNASVTLDHLQLVPASGANPVGSGLFAAGLVNVSFRQGGISGFTSNGSGGGILVSGSQLRLVDSDIADNAAVNGGGIYCNQGTIYLDQNSQVRRNSAFGDTPDGNGGGLYLNNCTLYSEARQIDAFGGPVPRGIVDNEANLSGGGIFADASTLRFQGGPLCSQSAPGSCRPHAAYVGLNSAGVSGGGFALINGSDLQLDFAVVIANVAGKRGGGILAASGSSVTFGALHALYPGIDRSRCRSRRFCNWLDNNRISPPEAGVGGGVWLEDASFAGVDLEMSGNTSAFARHLDASGNSTVILRQVQIGLGELELTGGQSQLIFRGNSTANVSHSSLFADGPDGIMLEVSGTASLTLDTSAIIMAGDADTVTLFDTASASGSCNAYSGFWSVGAMIDGIAVQPGDFEANGMPQAGTALIDACSSAGLLPQETDILLRPRVTTLIDANHPLDIGAMERPLDSVFIGGFED